MLGSSPTLTIRPYQQEAIESLYTFFAGNQDPSRNCLVAMPTGTGKSVVIAAFLKSIFDRWPEQKILVLTHVKELIAQNVRQLERYWPAAPVGIYSAGLKQKVAGMPITVAGIQSAIKHPEKFGRIDLVVVDEAHLVGPDDNTSYRLMLSHLREQNPYLRVIGLSATIYRLGLGMLTEGGIFTDVAYDICTKGAFVRLLDDLYLCPLIPMEMKTQLDVTGVHTRGGEFIEKELQEKVARYDLTRRALQEARVAAETRKHWLVFASGVKHVLMIHEILRDEFDMASVYVHAGLSSEERARSLEAFTTGEVPVMINANILTTGFDYPGLDCIVMLRPTASPVLHVQTLGRGTRYDFPPGMPLETREQRQAAIDASAKRDCLVLDFAGNTRRLGPINDPKLPKKKGDERGSDVPIKVCIACQCLNHISARECINCGEPFPIAEKITPVASTLELIVRDEPQTHWFPVQGVDYFKHIKRNVPFAPPTLRVTYRCDQRRFSEWVCLLHDGNRIQRKAHAWWQERTADPIPQSIEEALRLKNRLRVPKRILVWTNKQLPEILNYDFRGERAA